MHRWKHEALVSTWNGKAKVSCRCGWQTRSAPVEQSDQLMALYTKHTGLIERHDVRRR